MKTSFIRRVRNWTILDLNASKLNLDINVDVDVDVDIDYDFDIGEYFGICRDIAGSPNIDLSFVVLFPVASDLHDFCW